MFTYVKLKNYKSLVDFEVDLTDSKNNPKKMVIIYGENGAGKTNFINAFFTLFETLNTKVYKRIIDEFMEKKLDNKNDKRNIKLIINKIVKDNFKSIEDIINDAKTIDSKENVSLEFGFKLNGKYGKYYIEMGKDSIVREKLEYVLNKNKTKYFDISNKKIDINKSLFNSNKYLKEISDLVDKFWGKHSFLSIIFFEMKDKNKQYINKNIPKYMRNIVEYFLSMSLYIKQKSNIEKGRINVEKKFIFPMDTDSIPKNEEKKLNYTEKVLNSFFTTLYSDVKQVFYNKEYKDNKIKYRLFFKKQIYGQIKDIDFSLESTGTQKLLELFPLLIGLNKNQIVAIDELDSGIHDILISTVLSSIVNFIEGQLIITTHNTTLLETEIKKDYIYLFNIDSNGKKILIPITEYEREHPNTNFRKRYLKGLYRGIPMIDDIDFDDILNQDD